MHSHQLSYVHCFKLSEAHVIQKKVFENITYFNKNSKDNGAQQELTNGASELQGLARQLCNLQIETNNGLS